MKSTSNDCFGDDLLCAEIPNNESEINNEILNDKSSENSEPISHWVATSIFKN